MTPTTRIGAWPRLLLAAVTLIVLSACDAHRPQASVAPEPTTALPAAETSLPAGEAVALRASDTPAPPAMDAPNAVATEPLAATETPPPPADTATPDAPVPSAVDPTEAPAPSASAIEGGDVTPPGDPSAEADLPADLLEQITSLARLTPAGDDFTATASLEVRLGLSTVGVEIDTSGTIDLAAERRRLEKDLASARKELETTGAKLGNEAFLGKAPEHVVDKIRARRDLAAAEVERISGRLEAMPAGS